MVIQASRKARRIFYGYVLDITRGASATLEENLVISNQNDFIVTHIVGNATSTSFLAQFRDSVNGFQWSDGLINAGNLVGTAQQPFVLPRSKWIGKNGIIYYKIQDFSAAPNTIQLVLYGYEKYYELQDVLEVEDIQNGKYEYFSIPFNMIFAGSDVQKSDIQISSGYNFLVTHITGTKTGAYKLDIYDTGSNRHWLHNAGLGQTNDVNLVGTVNYPFTLARPKFIKGGSVVTLTATDTSTSANTVQVVLHGYRIPA
jgi:hypothetical protein